LVLFLGIGWPGAISARAQGTSPDDILGQVGFDQRLNAQAPLDLAFRDETGGAMRLGDYFGERPVVMILAYYKCPNVCSISLHQLSDALRQISFDAGDQYSVVAVSIDPNETPADAAAKKAEIVESYGRPQEASGWHFLVGAQPAIRQLAQAVGFRYAYDAQQHQFAHPIGSIVLTPQGKISRYFYGVDYQARDVRLGLVEAGGGRIGSPIDQLLLRCYHNDPIAGKYHLVTMNVVRLAGIATVALLGAFVLLMVRRDRRRELRV